MTVVVASAVVATVAQALRVALGGWQADFIRAARSVEDPPGKVRQRLARFKLIGLNSDHGLLRTSCSLVHADPVLVAQRLHGTLCASLDDAVMAGPEREMPERVRQIVEQAWPAYLDRLARELLHEAAHARRRPPHDRHSV
jgi:hypothetical protein